jgi:hypothetical protein
MGLEEYEMAKHYPDGRIGLITPQIDECRDGIAHRPAV